MVGFHRNLLLLLVFWKDCFEVGNGVVFIVFGVTVVCIVVVFVAFVVFVVVVVVVGEFGEPFFAIFPGSTHDKIGC